MLIISIEKRWKDVFLLFGCNFDFKGEGVSMSFSKLGLRIHARRANYD